MVSEDIIEKVWGKGIIIRKNPEIWREDQCGNLIKRGDYGNRTSNTGWEIDHIKPKSNGGTDGLSNLRPLQWELNVNRQDKRLNCFDEK